MMKQNKEHKNRPTCVTPSSKKLESPLDAKKKYCAIARNRSRLNKYFVSFCLLNKNILMNIVFNGM